MATTKPKTAAKKTAAKSKAVAAKKPVAKSKAAAAKKPASTVKVVAAPAKTKKVEKKEVENKGIFKGFFAKKYDANESILTIFKKPSLYGALIGELVGTLLLTLVMFALAFFGIYNAAIYTFAFIAITVAVFAFSGAQLNPIITAGMMATRRISVIRGVLYILVQVIGAMLGLAIFNAFYVTGGEAASYAVPTMAQVAEGTFGLVSIVEFTGAILLGFFFSRALAYKRSVFTFAAVVAGGFAAATLIGYIVSYAFLGLSNNFVFNPAVAMAYQIFPTAGANFGEIFGGICSALATYAIFPAIGGVAGFYLADFASALSSEEK